MSRFWDSVSEPLTWEEANSTSCDYTHPDLNETKLVIQLGNLPKLLIGLLCMKKTYMAENDRDRNDRHDIHLHYMRNRVHTLRDRLYQGSLQNRNKTITKYT